MKGVKVDLPLAWKTQDKMATVALFVALALVPGTIIANAPANLCFTNSERLEPSGDWVLPQYKDYMVSRCPLPYGDPADLYPNATAGGW